MISVSSFSEEVFSCGKSLLLFFGRKSIFSIFTDVELKKDIIKIWQNNLR